MKYLRNNRGDSLLGWVVVIATVSVIVATIIPEINTAIEHRKNATVEYFNGTDTITEFD